MDADQVTAEVDAFLRGHIESYEQLELLLALWRERRVWPRGEIATALIAEHSVIDNALQGLVSRGLVMMRSDGGSDTFAYSPASVAIDGLVTRLAEAFYAQPSRILRLMSAQAVARVRTGALSAFANAFVLRED